MGIDTSIYNSLLQRPKSVAEYDAEAMANQTNALGLQQSRMKMDEYTRSVADANKLRGVVSGFGADKGANYNALVGAGRLDEAQKYMKSNADIGKVEADAKESEAKAKETHLKAVNLKMGQAKTMLNTMQTPEQAAQWVRGMYADPDLGQVFSHGGDTAEAAIARIPNDPAKFQQWKMQASLGADELIKYTTPDANSVLTNQTARSNNAATVGATIRGQNMTDARQREATAQADRHFTATASAGKVPTGYRAKADGTLEPIPGGPADPNTDKGKGLNDSQSKALLFGTRMQEANKVLADLESSGTSTSVPGSRTPMVGGLINAMSSGNQQSLDQAKRDFMTATLRRESGASISPGEFDTADKQYFPQVGDSKQVIAQKRRNRELAIKGVLVEVPEKQRGAITPQAGVPDDIAKLLQKHGGK